MESRNELVARARARADANFTYNRQARAKYGRREPRSAGSDAVGRYPIALARTGLSTTSIPNSSASFV